MPFSDGGTNVVKNTGTGSGYAAFYRTAFSLTSGEGLSLRFKVSSTSADAIWRLESNGTTAQKLALLANSGLLRVRRPAPRQGLGGLRQAAAGAAPRPRPGASVPAVGLWGLRPGLALYQRPLRALRPAPAQGLRRPWTPRQGRCPRHPQFERFPGTTPVVMAMRGAGGPSAGSGAAQAHRAAMKRSAPHASAPEAWPRRGGWDSPPCGGAGGAAPRPGPGRSPGAVWRAQRQAASHLGRAGPGAEPEPGLARPAPGGRPARDWPPRAAAWRQTSACTSLGGCYAQQAAYEASGAPDHWKLGNNLFQNWMYDAANRPIRLQLGLDATVDQENDSLSAPAAGVFDRQYAFDGVGNISSLTDKRGVVALQSYAYDDRDRLTGWTLGGTTESYSYNPIGNLTSKAGVTQSYGSTGNGTGVGPHQARTVGGNSYSYDSNGNLTSGGGRSYVWTATNLPSQVTHNSVTETYGYDADDARVTKVRAGTTTVYLGGLWEETVGGVVRKYYTLAGQTVALRTIDGATNPVTYMQGDHLGSVSVVTTQAGVATTQEFAPWGKVRTGGITQTTRNFTGQILDDTGLLFYNARYYDPAIGRFVSADTVVPGSPSGSMDGVAVKSLTVSFHEAAFRGKLAQENALGFWFQLDDDQRRQHGSPMGPAQPQALNRYSYVLNNPMRWTDPGGHDPGENQVNGRSYSYVKGDQNQEYEYNGRTYKVDSRGRLYRIENGEKFFLMEVCNSKGCKYSDSASSNFTQFKAAVDAVSNGLAIAAAAGLGAAAFTCLASLFVAGLSCLAGIPIGIATFVVTFVATLIVYSGDADRAWDSMSSVKRPAGTYTRFNPRRRY